jgi:hypothetical protein
VGPPNIVDALKHNKIADPGLGQNISIETSKRIDSSAIVKDAISADAFIENRQA